MPWTLDNRGNKKYTASIYTKEELPTWSEMYEEFYLKEIFSYNPEEEEDQVLDIYWKIPRKKVLLAMACNQLNKMIFEDGLRQQLLEFISKEIGKNCIDVRFTCEPMIYKDKSLEEVQKDWSEMLNKNHSNTKDPPPIYTYPLPTGKKNPFITSTRIERIDISTLDKELKVFPLVIYFETDSLNLSLSFPSHDDDYDNFHKILEFILKEMESYFEGEGVGWKDENGYLIDSIDTKPIYDGAL